MKEISKDILNPTDIKLERKKDAPPMPDIYKEIRDRPHPFPVPDKVYAAESTAPKEKDSGEKTKEELIDDYIDDIRRNSEFPETIENSGEKYEKISPEENAKMREEFNEKRDDLIREWEEKNGKEWPRYTEDVYDEKTGNLIRRAGDRYDAHHIHPLSLSGKNEAGNITPISAEKHYDHRGIHAPDSPYTKLEEKCKEEI